MEKPAVSTTVSTVHSDDEKHTSEAQAASYWRPGYIRRFPALGFGSTIMVLLCSLASVAVLLASNQKPSSQWPERIAPNVVLSVLNAMSNLALALAVSKGSAIAWWRKAMHGATVNELHNSWSQSTSTYEILRYFFRIDTLGIAALAAKICVIDGIMFQRATTTFIGQDNVQNINMLGAAATEFPSTGYVVSNGFGAQSNCGCFMIGDQFTPIVNSWETSNGFFKGYNKYFQECDGTCFARIEAIGFEIDCTKETEVTNLATAAIAAWESSGGKSANSSAWTDIPIFNNSFTVSFANDTRNYSTIDFSLHYFQSEDPNNPSSATCPGTVFNVNCALRPALVTYPITITNYTNVHIVNGVALGNNSGESMDDYDAINSALNPPAYDYTNKQAQGFSVGSYLNPVESGKVNEATHLGGIANALSQYLSSSAAITYTGDSLWALKEQGTLAQTMMYGPPNMGSCDCSFRNTSLDVIVSSINQLAFMTATGSINYDTWSFPKSSSQNLFSSVAENNAPKLTVNSSTTVTVMGIGVNSTTNFRPLTGTQQIKDVTFYKTSYLYMGLGAGFTFFCILLVCPIYWKYGELGREVTLGPIEIAGAFRAPILSHPVEYDDFQQHQHPEEIGGGGAAAPPSPEQQHYHQPPSSPQIQITDEKTPAPTQTLRRSTTFPSGGPTTIAFANVDQLLDEVGNRKVTYGFMDVETGAQHAATPGSPLLSPGAAAHKRRSVLAFQDASGDLNRSSSVRSPVRSPVGSPATSPRLG